MRKRINSMRPSWWRIYTTENCDITGSGNGMWRIRWQAITSSRARWNSFAYARYCSLALTSWWHIQCIRSCIFNLCSIYRCLMQHMSTIVNTKRTKRVPLCTMCIVLTNSFIQRLQTRTLDSAISARNQSTTLNIYIIILRTRVAKREHINHPSHTNLRNTLKL